MNEIPRRVTLKPNGTYIWSAETDLESEYRNYSTGGRICKIAALVMFILGIGFALLYHSWEIFLYTAVMTLIIVLITLGVVRGQKSLGQRRCTYRLMDELIATGSGRKTAIFEFKKARKMTVGKNYIELEAKIGAFRAYVPEEDLNFVRGYIQSRVPMECEIIIV